MGRYWDDDDLFHHGVKGMKWGVKNGPPYPLGSDISTGKRLKTSLSGRIQTKNSPTKQGSTVNSQKVSEHRQHLIKSAISAEERRIYQNATDEQIRLDLEHQEKIKKAVIIGAAVIGAAAAGYILYRCQQHRVRTIAKAALMGGNPSTKDLQKLGLGLKEADGIKRLIIEGGAKVNLKDLDELVVKGHYDLELHNMKFNRVVFGQNAGQNFDFKKADNFLYATFLNEDKKWYRNFLGHTKQGLQEKYSIDFKHVDDKVLIPGRDSTNKIWKEMIDRDVDFLKKAEAGWFKMIRNRNTTATDAEIHKAFQDYIRQTDYTVFDTFIVGYNKSYNDMVLKAFKSAGYDGILDYHDIRDGLSKMPLILFNDSKMAFKKMGHEYLGRV